MGSITWRFSAHVHASADAVYAWMTDFTADDHNTEAFRRGARTKPNAKPSKRTIVSREGNVLRLEDQWGSSRFEATVTLSPQTRSYHLVGGHGYQATWRAIPEGDGTRFEVEGQFGSGLLGSIVGLFAKRFRKGMEDDFQGHLEDLRASLKA